MMKSHTPFVCAALLVNVLLAQPAPAPAAAPAPALSARELNAIPFRELTPEQRQQLGQFTAADHADMLKQLGITKLRPGKNGNTAAGTPNQANYDEALANPYPDWPEVLVLKNGQTVTTPEAWWNQRRPEITEDFEREVVGRIPANVPGVKWEVKRTLNTTLGGIPVVANEVIGRVDNSAHPGIAVNIKMAVVLPAVTDRPVPVLIM